MSDTPPRTPPYSEATRDLVIDALCKAHAAEESAVAASARVLDALAAAGLLLPEGAAEPLPMRWFDEIVSTDVRLNGYAYGGGADGTGIQITLDDSNRILAARLPWTDARAFALAILAAIGPVPPEPKEGA